MRLDRENQITINVCRCRTDGNQLALPIHAETAAQTQNLFENAGKKQTNKDFKPAPDEIKTNFGTLKFDLEAFPTEETPGKSTMRWTCSVLTQAYMDFIRPCRCTRSSRGRFGTSISTLHPISPWPRSRLATQRTFLTGNNQPGLCDYLPRPESRSALRSSIFHRACTGTATMALSRLSSIFRVS